MIVRSRNTCETLVVENFFRKSGMRAYSLVWILCYAYSRVGFCHARRRGGGEGWRKKGIISIASI